MSLLTNEQEIDQGRRAFLKKSVFVAAGVAAMPSIIKPAFANYGGAYRVSFRNAHTSESFSGVYRVGDKYLPEAFGQINYVLRDFRTGGVKMIDPHLMDLIYWMHFQSGSQKPFEVVSGYRSPHTNAMLRRASSGVARKSLHMEGKAIDLRLGGVKLSKLHHIALDMRAGGVGFYPRSNFLHVDTGRIRHW